jgi:hypothetical protein
MSRAGTGLGEGDSDLLTQRQLSAIGLVVHTGLLLSRATGDNGHMDDGWAIPVQGFDDG